MASKNGTFNLSAKDRAKLLLELQKTGDISRDIPAEIKKELESAVQQEQEQQQKTQPQEADTAAVADNELLESFGTGCLCCGEDDDHANLLLCEYCNAEYHTYCCEPPLRQVPTNDWYCSSCKAAIATEEYFQDDGLDRLVSALSPSFTSRFGEIVWAHGGAGFGWWPAFIYDPRFTVGSARELASKHLGKRHLVYFFECHDAPFAVLTSAKLTKWEDGLIEDYHMGKTAKSAGKVRLQSFQQAMQAATLELAKPIEMRMDWNHSELPQILPSPQKKKVKPPAYLNKKKRQRKNESSFEDNGSSSDSDNDKKKNKKRRRHAKPPKGFPLLSSQVNEGPPRPSKRNLTDALGAFDERRSRRINAIVDSGEDGELFVKLLYKFGGPPVESEKVPASTSDANSTSNAAQNVGFIKLPSRKDSTFADARSVIQEELVPDGILQNVNWRFFVPGLGPVSTRQEKSMGPIFGFLQRTTLDANLGEGTTLNPLKVFVVEWKDQRNSSTGEMKSTTTTNQRKSSTGEMKSATTTVVPENKKKDMPTHNNQREKESAVNHKSSKEAKPLSLLDVCSSEQPLKALVPSVSASDSSDCVLPVSAFPPLSAFDITVKFPALVIPARKTNEFRKRLQSIMLRRPRCKVVAEVRSSEEGTLIDEQSLPLLDGERLPPEQCRKLVLDPGQINVADDNSSTHPLLAPLVSSQEAGLTQHTMKFSYDDWTTDELLKRLLEPQGIGEIPSAFEAVGHLAHLNLRPELLPYQYLIGKVLLDKHQPAIRTIVNKVGSIDTQFRTFGMKVIAGYEGPDWSMVEVKEEGCTYRLDFQTVYWNSRLAGEHRRLVRIIQKQQRSKAYPVVVADMMAGIGPFAVPLTCSKNATNDPRVTVYANDLNPSSYQYLVENGKKNKCDSSHLHTYNMDARAFCHQLQDEGVTVHHFIMNLPASALEFLDAFRGYKVVGKDPDIMPTIHVHCFASKDQEEAHKSIFERAEKALGCALDKAEVSIHNVRDVAPNKNMYCVTFQLPEAAQALPRVKIGSDETAT